MTMDENLSRKMTVEKAYPLLLAGSAWQPTDRSVSVKKGLLTRRGRPVILQREDIIFAKSSFRARV
jgi:hypothetical protein